MREKEAREVYALLKCSDYEYEEAVGDSPIPTGPHSPEKIVLATGAMQHLLQSKRMASRKDAISRGSDNHEGTMDSGLIGHPLNIVSLLRRRRLLYGWTAPHSSKSYLSCSHVSGSLLPEVSMVNRHGVNNDPN